MKQISLHRSKEHLKIEVRTKKTRLLEKLIVFNKSLAYLSFRKFTFGLPKNGC